MKLLISVLVVMAFVTGCASIPKTVKDWRISMNYDMVEGYQMAFKSYGQKSDPTVLMLHGLPTSSYLYRDVAPRIAELGFYVVVPDMLGFGASDKPDDINAYDVPTRSAHMQTFLNQQAIDEFHLVVHDLGGPVGFELLADSTDQVTSLVILNTTAFEGFNPPKEMKMMAGWMSPMMTHMMRSSLTGKAVTKKFFHDNMAKDSKLTKEQVENYWWPIREGATRPMVYMAKTFDDFIAGFSRYQNAFNAYQQPVTLIWGEQDPVLGDTDIAQNFVETLSIKKKDQTYLSDASHFAIEDDTTAVLQAMLNHFKIIK
jgi:pimeloyl-ACP methyl ester carboxylesterase